MFGNHWKYLKTRLYQLQHFVEWLETRLFNFPRRRFSIKMRIFFTNVLGKVLIQHFSGSFRFSFEEWTHFSTIFLTIVFFHWSGTLLSLFSFLPSWNRYPLWFCQGKNNSPLKFPGNFLFCDRCSETTFTFIIFSLLVIFQI